MWGSVPESNSNHQQFQTPCFMAPDIIQADMNHADPNTMRARARQATEILKTQLLGTGAIEPLVALYFDDHIEQVEFQDPSVLEHFDVRTARSFDYLRTLVRICVGAEGREFALSRLVGSSVRIGDEVLVPAS